MTHLTRARAALLILGSLLFASPTVAAYDPAPGAELLDRFRSPLFLAGTSNSASEEAVAADPFNPAASARRQRIHLNGSYLALVGGGRWAGHAANLGIAVPTRAGVLTGSLDFATASYQALSIGTRGSLNLSFAKELYPNLLFGAGLRGHLLGGGAVGVGLDLGIIRLAGPAFGLADLRWGFAIQQLGFIPSSGSATGSPAPFTPVADLAATIIDGGPVAWSVHTGLSFPSFQNVRYRAGTSLELFDLAELRVGWEVDLREQLGDAANASPLLPSVGLTVRVQTGGGRSGNPSDLTVHSAWAPLYRDVWATGAGVNLALGVIDENPPTISLTYPEVSYISPNNDGASDELLLPVGIRDERFVSSWTLNIVDADGAPVRRIENTDQRAENLDLGTIIDRLLYVQTGVEVPEQIRWDGRTEAGEVAADGTYTFTLSAADDNENRAVTEAQLVVVDRTPPTVTPIIPDEPDALIFSPNDDGNKDVLTIEQEGSVEDLWRIEVRSIDGALVYEERVENAAPPTFTWDGTDSQGVLVPDGVYEYTITAVDRAENAGGAQVDNIIVNTQPTPIGLSIDVGHFSPNGDGIRDAVTLTPEVPVTQGIRSWRYEVRDAGGVLVRVSTTSDATPQPWSFNGRSEAGERLGEGPYDIELVLEYRNGNRPRAAAPTVVLDTTAPRARVIADTPVFSPNGDGRLDTVSVAQEPEGGSDWSARIVTGEGQTVRTLEFEATPPRTVIWDGSDDEGRLLADGQYIYSLIGRDLAGNETTVRTPPILLDTRETPVFVSADREAFSPNGDGAIDTIFLLPEIADPAGIERFSLALLDEQGAVVGRIDGGGVPEERYPWDGRGRTGAVVADGRYRIELAVEYRNGNRPTAVSAPFTVDTRAPQVSVRAADSLFSPDGDGAEDTIRIVQESTSEALWEARVVNVDSGRPVRSWSFSGQLEPIDWDGTNDDGDVVADGSYRYEVASRDAAGNRAGAVSEVFRTDTREVEVSVRADLAAFSPNGDGVLDSVRFIPRLSVDAPVRSWNLELVDEDGAVRFERSGSTTLDAVVWDGSTPGGAPAPEGPYRARLSVLFERGDTVTTSTPRTLALDRTAPEAEVRLSSTIISPNGDGALDQLEISQTTSSEDRWVARIEDQEGSEVGRWEWIGSAPQTLTFGGLDTERRRLSDGLYTYSISATDAAGNTGQAGPLSFEIYTAETPLALNASTQAFSPNGDGTLDVVVFRPVAGTAEGLEEWVLTISDESGQPLAERRGTTIPEEIVWRGETASGGRAAEGRYTATIVASYRHGNRPRAEAGPVVLDTSPPTARVESTATVFSPDGDGQRDEVEIVQSGDAAASWRGSVTAADGELVRTFTWDERPAGFVWDGTDVAGNTVPDGRYSYQLTGRDAAGNTTTVDLADLRVDTRPTPLFLTASERAISPNGDGVRDSVELTAIISRTDGVEQAVIAIVDRDGQVVREFAIDGSAGRRRVTWNGRGNDGPVADGLYAPVLRVSYTNGARPTASTPILTVDTTAPEATVDLDGLPFSPDNDGRNDELGISISVADRSAIDSWQLEILDRNQRPFQLFEGSGQPRDRIVWDGRGTGGDTVISAEDYPYRLTVTDSVGNTQTVEGAIPIDILVVRDGDRLRIQIASITFLPNSPELELTPETPAGARNLSVLGRLVEIFDRYETYRIRIEGHAVNITGTEREEREELEPLSLARAERVRNELIRLGMEPDRITTLGRGGTEPVVPHTDLDERWKNRRVEFILLR